MTESDAVERTLAAARAAFVAPVAARARLRAGLQASGAFGAANARVRGAVVRGRLAPATVGVLVALGFGAGYWLGRAHTSGPLAASAPAVSASLAAAPSLAAPSLAAPSPAAPSPAALTPSTNADGVRSFAETRADAERAAAPRARAKVSPRSAGNAHAGSFAQELALLQRAERALRAGEPELALSLVAELERRYPGSTLSEERAAVRLMAECTAAVPGSRARAERFLSDRRASVYTDRVRKVCELGALAPPSAVSDGTRSSGH